MVERKRTDAAVARFTGGVVARCGRGVDERADRVAARGARGGGGEVRAAIGARAWCGHRRAA
jgi:hypothetical protein